MSNLNRDLRFHASMTERFSALTPEQVATFIGDGYLMGIPRMSCVDLAAALGRSLELFHVTLGNIDDNR